MKSNIRNSASDSKAAVHSVNSKVENDTELDLVRLVKKMRKEEQVKNKKFESYIVNLTELVKGANHKAESEGGGCLLRNSKGHHDIRDFYRFKGCNSKDRFEMRKSNGICFRCLKGYPPARSCKVGKMFDVSIAGQRFCNSNHHPFWHPDK